MRYFFLYVTLLLPIPSFALWENATEMMREEETAPFYSGNALYEISTSNRPLFLGYVAGAHDSLKARSQFCSPPRATMGQVADVVVKYLRENPSTRDQQGHLLVRNALAAAWPCPRPRPSR